MRKIEIDLVINEYRKLKKWEPLDWARRNVHNGLKAEVRSLDFGTE